jgi:hypothetical protein
MHMSFANEICARAIRKYIFYALLICVFPHRVPMDNLVFLDHLVDRYVSTTHLFDFIADK